MSELKENAIALLSTTTSTALNQAASTIVASLYTVPSGKTLIISEIWLKISGNTGAAGKINIGSSTVLTDYSVGCGAGGDIILTNLDATNDVIIIKPLPSLTPLTQKVYSAGTIIQVSIDTAASNAVTGVFYLFGFLY